MFYYRVNRIGLIWDSEHIGISGTRTTMSQKTHLSKPLIFQPRLRSESLSDLLQVRRQCRGGISTGSCH